MAAFKISFLVTCLVLVLILSTQSFKLPSPEQLRAARSFLQKREGDGSHWCCKKELKPVVEHITKQEVQRYLVKKNYTYVVEYVPCDPEDVNMTLFFCPQYKTDIVQEPRYRMATVTLNRTHIPSCNEKDLVCCKGFSLYMNNCYEPNELETIKSLIDSGLIG